MEEPATPTDVSATRLCELRGLTWTKADSGCPKMSTAQIRR